MKWKLLFGIAGLISLALVLHNYGYDKIGHNLQSMGWWSIPLCLSFFPVLFLYSLVWWLVTPQAKIGILGELIKYTTIGIAWNNLSPFVKILGEPIKVSLLQKHISQKDALRSVILYNLVHTYGTIGAFATGAGIILCAYPVPPALRNGFFLLILVSVSIILALTQIPKLTKKIRKKTKRNLLSKTVFWIRWSFSKIRVFSNKHPFRFWSAIVIEIAARFVEGITFYVAFFILKDSITIPQAALLDVGRAVFDNVFFFIPYQVGSREASIQFLAQNVLSAGHDTAIGAAIFYRMVEISWMGIGYILWINAGRSRRVSI